MNVRIRDLREDRDLTQQVVSKAIDCDQSLYSKYERGEREIPLRVVYALAEYYGTSIDYLLGRTDEAEPYPAAKQR